MLGRRAAELALAEHLPALAADRLLDLVRHTRALHDRARRYGAVPMESPDQRSRSGHLNRTVGRAGAGGCANG